MAEKGDISYGEIRLEPAHRKAWQQQISYAVQDGFLFDATVRDNVLWPDRRDDDAAIWDALEQACIADIVRALPKGLDENIRNAGSRLSGGERQRIALARAFLRPSNILILDESLSALDAQTAEQLIANLQIRAKRQLVILVSHITAHAHKADAHIIIADGHATLVNLGK
jgi:ATP-binding cassette subfamily C protein